ncbi:hypothetical protein EU527_16985 [Candidatus Thorarchaeota archaeon]|nr:MAG: hypothetical protein EU527_16985 [Candidatus Thorarchaeota archaeon]
MAVQSIKMMQAENRLKEYAFSFFIEIGCLSPATSKSLIQLKALGFGVTDTGLRYLLKYGFVETQEGKMYLDIKRARYKIKRTIVGMALGLFIMSAIIYFIERSIFYGVIITPLLVIIFVFVLIPITVYYAKPLKYLKS